jgi:6-phospho-beta-glucosidase
VTLREACQALAVPLDRLEWDYCGLNHRGFLHRLSVEGQDLLPRVAAAADQRPIGGVRGATIRELAALPLKYFRFYSGEAGGGGGRAEALRDLRRRLSAELDGAPGGPAPALGERNMDWYPHAVVPFLSAVLTDSGAILTVNAYDEAAGLVAERRVRVRADRIEALGTSPPPPAVAAWLDRAMAQERAAARAVATREVTWIRRALDLDPLVPPSAAAELSLALAASAARPLPPIA